MLNKVKWQYKKLEELTEEDRPITYGVVKPGDSDDVDGVLFVRGGDIFDGKIALKKLRRITKKISGTYKRTLLRGGELLVSLVGNPGQVAIAPENLKGSNIARQVGMVSLKASVFAPYVMYYLISPLGKGELTAQTTGSVQTVINLSELKKVRIALPPLPVQHKIANVLSAYDDLIEVNAQRICVLDNMAQSVYREWFGKVVVKSLPQGWEMKELQDTELSIIDGDRGKNYPSKSEFGKEGYCLFLNAGNFKDDRFDYSDNDFITEEKDNLLRKGRLQPNDTVLTTRGTVGKIAFFSENAPYKNMRINSGMVIIRPKENSLYWYFLLKSPLLKEQYKSYASGSAQPQLPIKDMNKINVLVPAENVISQFCEIVEPIAAQIEILLLANTNLRRTRDLLLPRLVSGEVGVEGL